MSHSLAELGDQFPQLIEKISRPDQRFSTVDDCFDFNSESLIFVSDESQLSQLEQSIPAAVVTNAKLEPQVVSLADAIVIVSNVRLAQALIKQQYNDFDASDSEWPAIHPSAVVHESARLDDGARIGPNVTIGKDVEVGAGTQIRANCVIESGARIGEECIVHSLVNIGQQCRLGNRVIVRPGVIIGSEGFGFAQDEQRRYHRIPHTGIVVIEDDVQIGSNCNIDRGTYGETRINRGVKLDALCHVAHNCTVDEDALFVAQCGLAGSVHIGKRVILSGQTGVLDHMSIADDVVLVHRGGVIEDLKTAGLWAGTPAKPFKEYVSNLNANKRLARKIAKLEAELAQLKSEADSQ